LKRLAKDSFTNKKASYSYDDSYHFHIMIEAGLIFLCMADHVFAARRAFAYLVDIRNLFLSEVFTLSLFAFSLMHYIFYYINSLLIIF
jgi:hypothetical protein